MCCTCNAEGKNFLEIAIAKAHAATTHGRIHKTMKALTDKFECQSFSGLIREYVGTCNICQRTKYLRRGPIGCARPLRMPVRLCSNITMDFLILSLVFTKCSILYPNIPVGEDHLVGVSWLWTIVCYGWYADRVGTRGSPDRCQLICLVGGLIPCFIYICMPFVYLFRSSDS